MNKLRSSKAEAEVHLKERISQGRILLDKNVVIPNDFESFKKEFNAWNNYNRELLNKLFVDNKVSEEYKFCALSEVIRPAVYDNSMVVDLRSMRVRLKAKSDKLEEILGRLSLYDGGIDTDTIKVQNQEIKRLKTITEDSIRDITPHELIKLAKKLSIGGWLLIAGVIFGTFGIGYKTGFDKGKALTSIEKTNNFKIASNNLPVTIDNRNYTNFTIQNMIITPNGQSKAMYSAIDQATGDTMVFASQATVQPAKFGKAIWDKDKWQ